MPRFNIAEHNRKQLAHFRSQVKNLGGSSGISELAISNS
jgi:hypothetical protein